MATCSTNSLLASGRLFQQLGGGLSKVARLALLKQILLAANPSADTSVNTLLESGKCFTCLTPGQQRIVKLQLLCEILNAEGDTPVVPMPTDMLLWLNQEGLEDYFNDDPIPVWFDSSGNGNDANSSGDSDPVGGDFGGNIKCAFFEEESVSRFFVVAGPLFSGNGPRTVFGVYKRTLMTFPGAVCGCGAQLNNQLSALYSRDDINGGLCSPYHASFITDFAGPFLSVANTPYADAYRHDGATLSLWRNGINVASQAQVLNTQSGTFNIGGTPGPNDLFAHGFIAEVIVWNRALTDPEMNAVYTYLNAKYGL